MTWCDERLAALDVETTAVDPNVARIVSASIVRCGGGLPTESFSLLVDPGVEIPEDAARVHGITTEQARLRGTPAARAVPVIVETLRAFAVRHPLVVFNSPYDLTVADREARRHGVEPLDVESLRVIDPLVIDKWLDRYRKGSRKLAAQAEHYGAKLDGAHDATFDALCAARVAWAIGKRGRVIRRVRNEDEATEMRQLCGEWEQVRFDVDALHAAQQRWAREERGRFEEYRRSRGEPVEPVWDWPLIPFREAVVA